MKRQVPFGPWILDFAIPSARVAVEVDGDTHAMPVAKASDVRRDLYLRDHGWVVLRFTNAEVTGNIDGVLTTILTALSAATHPAPCAHAGANV